MTEKRNQIPKDHSDALSEMVRAAAGYCDVSVYFDDDTEWWCVEAVLLTEKVRRVKISQEVIDSPDTDWPLLIHQLRGLVATEFRHPGGCVIRVRRSWEPHHPGGFWIRLDTLDGQPRKAGGGPL